MKRINLIVMAFLLFAAVFQQACTKEPDSENTLVAEHLSLPEEPYAYNNQQLPEYGPFLGQINNDVATLGRVLFYDKLLSANNSVACASCHLQSLAFSDGVAFSKGFNGRNTTRNAMAIINPARENGYFWDLRERSLKSMVSKPVQNHIEMGFDTITRITGKINKMPYYPPLFKKAFGTEEIDADKIQEALTQFLTSMTTYNSKYDEGLKIGFSNFTSKENLGRQLYMEKLHCNHCHSQPGFTSEWMGAANIGLDEHYADAGLRDGSFKIPSLRNIALTAPYMHDGRFKTLEAVIEHYNSGVKSNPYLDWNLIDQNSGDPKRLNLTSLEKDALIAFLNTLTDTKFITDPKYSSPFMN